MKYLDEYRDADAAHKLAREIAPHHDAALDASWRSAAARPTPS